MFETTPFKRENNDIARGDNFSGQMEMNQSPFIVDIRESNDVYLIEAELPGVNKEDINVADNFVKRERHFGELKRSFYIDNIDESKIETSFEEGILRVILYKHPKTQMRRIDTH